MYAVGKVLVAFWISVRTWLASLQPNMGSLYIDQYLQHVTVLTVQLCIPCT